MTRINDRLLVQSPAPEVIVIMDNATGEEVEIPQHDVPRVIYALQYFAPDPDPEPHHRYRRNPQSEAGYCVCGMAKQH